LESVPVGARLLVKRLERRLLRIHDLAHVVLLCVRQVEARQSSHHPEAAHLVMSGSVLRGGQRDPQGEHQRHRERRVSDCELLHFFGLLYIQKTITIVGPFTRESEPRRSLHYSSPHST